MEYGEDFGVAKELKEVKAKLKDLEEENEELRLEVENLSEESRKRREQVIREGLLELKDRLAGEQRRRAGSSSVRRRVFKKGGRISLRRELEEEDDTEEDEEEKREHDRQFQDKLIEVVIALKGSLEAAHEQAARYRDLLGECFTDIERLLLKGESRKERIRTLEESLQRVLAERHTFGQEELQAQLREKERTIAELSNANRRLRLQMDQWGRYVSDNVAGLQQQAKQSTRLQNFLQRAQEMAQTEKKARMKLERERGTKEIYWQSVKEDLEKEKEESDRIAAELRQSLQTKEQELEEERKRKREKSVASKRSTNNKKNWKQTEDWSDEGDEEDEEADEDSSAYFTKRRRLFGAPPPINTPGTKSAPVVVDLLDSD